MKTSPESLSLVLPVHNGALTLAERIAELLEILPELTRQFEVLIVDNGSTDLTEEIALDLVRQFPQVRMTRESQRRTAEHLLELGMSQTQGAHVILLDEQAPLLPGRLRQLWNLRSDEGLLAARAEKNDEKPVVERLKDWARHLPPQNGDGVQIIRRAAPAPIGGHRLVAPSWSIDSPNATV